MANRKSKPKTQARDPAAQTPLHVEMEKGDTPRQAIARKIAGPFSRHGLVVGEATARMTEGLATDQRPGLVEYAWAVKERSDKAADGNPEQANEMLMAQAISLDAIFAELARIALVNVYANMDATERYMRLALKAQSGSRAALEAWAKLHQPREQTVRHVHVNEGGQAVIADQFHHHAGGHENENRAGQPLAPPTGAAGPSTALPCPDPQRIGVPVPRDQGGESMPDARREGQRRAQG